MKKSLLLLVAAAFVLIGCGSSDVVKMPAPSTPAKGTFTDATQNNPKIPDSAKRAMRGMDANPH